MVVVIPEDRLPQTPSSVLLPQRRSLAPKHCALAILVMLTLTLSQYWLTLLEGEGGRGGAGGVPL